MLIKDIKTLSFNSFLGARIISHFLSGCNNHKIKFELIFLVLPIINQNSARLILSKANNKSTIQTCFLDKVDGNSTIANINKKLAFFRSLTQTALIVAASDFNVVVNDHIYVTIPLEFKNEKNPYIKEYYRSAYYLGQVLSTNSYLDTLIKLGVKTI